MPKKPQLDDQDRQDTFRALMTGDLTPIAKLTLIELARCSGNMRSMVELSNLLRARVGEVDAALHELKRQGFIMREPGDVISLEKEHRDLVDVLGPLAESA